jgi:hypothetical protein
MVMRLPDWAAVWSSANGITADACFRPRLLRTLTERLADIPGLGPIGTQLADLCSVQHLTGREVRMSTLPWEFGLGRCSRVAVASEISSIPKFLPFCFLVLGVRRPMTTHGPRARHGRSYSGRC